MRRTQWLQEAKRMRFEEAYSGWGERRLTQVQAAQLLGVCTRTFRRYIHRYEDEGLDGLLDQRMSQISHRRAPVDEVLRMVDRYRRRHEGWSAKHLLRLVSPGWRPAQLQLGADPSSGVRRGGKVAAQRVCTASAASVRRGRGCCCTRTGVRMSGWRVGPGT